MGFCCLTSRKDELLIQKTQKLPFFMTPRPGGATCANDKHIYEIGPVLNSFVKSRILLEAPKYEYTTDRHSTYPTPDIPIREIPWLELEMQPVIDRIMRDTAQSFGIPNAFWLRDMFLVRYTQEGQSELKFHSDASLFSFIIQVSDPSIGEGTNFQDTSETRSAAPGNAILFCGSRTHRGLPLVGKERIIITGFLDADPRAHGWGQYKEKYKKYFYDDIHRPYIPWNLRKMKTESGLSEITDLANALVSGNYLPEQMTLRKKVFRCGGNLKLLKTQYDH